MCVCMHTYAHMSVDALDREMPYILCGTERNREVASHCLQ